MAPTIKPNITNMPGGIITPGRGGGRPIGPPPRPIMPGGVAGGPGGGRRPPIVKPRPPGIKKGGAVAKKKKGGGVKKKVGGSVKKMQGGGALTPYPADSGGGGPLIQALPGLAPGTRPRPPGDTGRRHVPGLVGRSSYHSDALKALRRNPPPTRPYSRGVTVSGPGGKKGGAVKRKKGGSVKR